MLAAGLVGWCRNQLLRAQRKHGVSALQAGHSIARDQVLVALAAAVNNTEHPMAPPRHLHRDASIASCRISLGVQTRVCNHKGLPWPA